MKTPKVIIQKYLGDGWVDVTKTMFLGQAKRKKKSFESKDKFSAFRLFDSKIMSPIK